jgi:hypothetical protein
MLRTGPVFSLLMIAHICNGQKGVAANFITEGDVIIYLCDSEMPAHTRMDGTGLSYRVRNE